MNKQFEAQKYLTKVEEAALADIYMEKENKDNYIELK